MHKLHNKLSSWSIQVRCTWTGSHEGIFF